jgi:transcription elongation factor GreA
MQSFIITQEVFEQLEHEIDQLKNQLRPQIVQRLAAARREGDLKENGGYQAARSELRMLDTRIKVIDAKIQNAQIVAKTNSDRVGVGAKVSAEIDGEKQTFVLGESEFRKITDLAIFSNLSPLGQSILNRRVGDQVSYTAPNGKEIQVKILKIESL